MYRPDIDFGLDSLRNADPEDVADAIVHVCESLLKTYVAYKLARYGRLAVALALPVLAMAGFAAYAFATGSIPLVGGLVVLGLLLGVETFIQPGSRRLIGALGAGGVLTLVALRFAPAALAAALPTLLAIAGALVALATVVAFLE